jgi:hypothetical protein
MPNGIMSNKEQMEIGRYRGGKSAESLNKLIAGVWADAMKDPVARAEIAAILELPPDVLRSAPPPVEASVSEAGLTGAEILIALASGFVLAVPKEVGSDGGKITVQAVKGVWAKLRRRLISADAEALGDESGPHAS